jgi:hypothetical protein
MWLHPNGIVRLAQMFGVAPRLHSVTCLGFVGHLGLDLPWQQLTLLNLKGSHLSPERCPSIIQACQNLKVGRFAILFPYNHELHSTRFNHHHLEVLELRTIGVNYFEQLFDSLTLPHLYDLVIEVDDFQVDLSELSMIWSQSRFKSHARQI